MNNSIAKKKKDDLVKAYVFGIIALILISVTSMASYLSYDEVGALQPRFESEYGFSTTQIMLLYSAYSFAVIGFVVVGGILADKLGVTKSAILWAFLIALGTGMFAIKNFTIMVAGRIIFGLACEAFYVVQNKIISKWFKKKMLATAFGINLFITRAGTLLSFAWLPGLVKENETKTVLLIVTASAVVGVITSILYLIIDRIGEKRNYVDFVEDTQEEAPSIKEALKLPKAFWVISLLCVVFYSAVFPFQSFSTDFFMERYNFDHESAGFLTSRLAFISMLITWLCGALIDRIGKRATIMIIGSAILIPCHISMGFTSIPPIIAMAALGFAFSLVPGSLWPAIPKIVKENQLGTAYGVIAMIQNIGLLIFPLLVGVIRDYSLTSNPAYELIPNLKLTSAVMTVQAPQVPIMAGVSNVSRYFQGSYNMALLMFALLGVVGVIAAVWLKNIEKKGGGYLEKV